MTNEQYQQWISRGKHINMCLKCKKITPVEILQNVLPVMINATIGDYKFDKSYTCLQCGAIIAKFFDDKKEPLYLQIEAK